MHLTGDSTSLSSSKPLGQCVALLSFQDCIHAFLVSLKSIDEKGIEHIANDNCGARVLEQFFNNEEIPKPMKKTVLSKLKNRWTQLAMSSSGSHLLEACFNFAVICEFFGFLVQVIVSCRNLS